MLRRIGLLVACGLLGTTGVVATTTSAGAQAFPGADFVTPVLVCDHVVGTGSVPYPGTRSVAIAKPPADRLSPEWLPPDVATSASTAKGYVAPCTGPFRTSGGPDVGDLKSMKMSFRGRENCIPPNGYGVDHNQYPSSGTVAFTFTNSDINGRPYRATARVVVGLHSNPTGMPDLATVSGIVYAGVARGAIVSGETIWQTTAVQASSGTGTTPVPSASSLDLTPFSGAVVPRTASLNAGAICAAGGAGLRSLVWGTDGVSLLGTPLNSAMTFSLPSPASGAASVPPARVPTTTVFSCDHVAGQKGSSPMEWGGSFLPWLTNVSPARSVLEPWTQLTTLAKLKRALMLDQINSPCSNYVAANDDYATIVGDLATVSVVTHGRENCDPFAKYTIDPDQYPLNGTAVLKFANLDANGRPYRLHARIVIGPVPQDDIGTLPEAVTISGIVDSGVAKGALISGTILEQPTRTGTTFFNPISILTAGIVVPGTGSLNAAVSCLATGSPQIDRIVWGTDGGGLLGSATLDSAITFELPK